jgi:hypothetical protein
MLARRLVFLGMLLFSCLGFADDYQIKSVPVQPVTSYPARAVYGPITIAADPYITNERSYTAFDVKDLNSRGYFPVHIVIQNSARSYISIRTRDIILVTSAGQEFYTTPATLLVDDIFKSGLISKLPKMKGRDPSVSMKVGSPLSDFTSKELTNRQIEPGTVSDGFVFFYSKDKDIDLFSGSKIVIPQVTDEDTRKPLGPCSIRFGQ